MLVATLRPSIAWWKCKHLCDHCMFETRHSGSTEMNSNWAQFLGAAEITKAMIVDHRVFKDLKKFTRFKHTWSKFSEKIYCQNDYSDGV